MNNVASFHCDSAYFVSIDENSKHLSRFDFFNTANLQKQAALINKRTRKMEEENKSFQWLSVFEIDIL